MKKLSLAATTLALLALAACGRGDQDQINSTDNATAETLDELSDEAANLAAEAEVLENQAAELDQEAQAADNASGPETPADENIAGM